MISYPVINLPIRPVFDKDFLQKQFGRASPMLVPRINVEITGSQLEFGLKRKQPRKERKNRAIGTAVRVPR